MIDREGPLRVLFVGVDGTAVEGVTAALEREGDAEATRVDPDGTAPADAAVEEYDCLVVGTGAPDAWTDGPSAVPRLRVRTDGADESGGGRGDDAAAERLAARVRAATGVSDERRRAVERSAEEVYTVDDDWRIAAWNSAIADRTGRPAAAVLGEVLWEAFPELAGSRIEAEYRSAMESGTPRVFETRRVGSDESVESRIYPDETGATVYTRNVSEWRERARRLDRYEAALESVRDPVFAVDDDGRVAFANASALALAGGSDADAGNASLGDLLGDDDAGRMRRTLDAALDAARTERADGFERQVVAGSGTAGGRRSVDYRVTPFTSEGRAYALAVGRDAAQTERARRRARAAAERLESIVGTAPTPVVGMNADGEVTLWNGAAERTFGWSRSEVLGEPNPIVPDSERADFEVNRRRVLDGERIDGQEVRRRNRAGETLDLRLWGARTCGPDGEEAEAIAVFEDRTERKRHVRRLRALQAATGRLNAASTAAEIAERAVTAAVDVLGMELTVLYEYDPERNALVPVASGDATDETFDGLPTFEAGDGLVWEVFEAGEPRTYEDVRSEPGRYNGGTAVGAELIVPLGGHGVLLTGSTEAHAFDEREVTMFRSLAAAVEAALTRADREERLTRQNERLEAFSRVVAHDLRNPLTVADGFLELARESGDPDAFDRVERAIDRMSRLVDDLLVLAREGGGDREHEPVDLAAVAAAAWRNVRTGAATLDADGLPEVVGDADRLLQLFENCFRNAVDHGDDGVTVRAGTLDGGGFYVEDDGPGIPATDRGAVFDHGYTTRRDGTGFGLPIVEDIAAAHGWSVEAAESDDGGARFEFRPA